MIRSIFCLLILGAQSINGFAASSVAEVELTGDPSTSGLSGFRGTTYPLGDPNSKTHALDGVYSREKSDNPCYVAIGWEDINHAFTFGTIEKDLCGGHGSNVNMLTAQYPDSGGKSNWVFITGIQVCMNKSDDRIKGIHVHGKRITDTGQLADFNPDAQDSRTNCHQDHWQRWADCPAGQIATSAIMHFEAGKTPRSWTGVELQCRRLHVTGTVNYDNNAAGLKTK